jgi:long-chain acyl-CoA synthetase
VGFVTPKSPYQHQIFYATWWLGGIAVPISEGLADLEMGFVIRDSEPSVLVTDDTMFESVRANAGDIRVFRFSDLPGDEDRVPTLARRPVAEDSVAALIYTSGSTGMPKGVMLTHRNFVVNGRSAVEVVRIEADDSIISLLPYWHSYALVVEVVVPILIGVRVIIPKDKRDFRRNINLYQPTIMLVVPRILDALRAGLLKKVADMPEKRRRIFDRAIHNASRIFTAGPRLDGGILRLLSHHVFYDPVVFRKVRQGFGGKLRFFVSGGAPLDMEHQIFFKYLGLPVYQGYGLTEATPLVSTNYEEAHRLGSCGRLLPWLWRENGGDYTFKTEDGRTAPELHGELLISGDCVMKGYWRHTDASSKTLADGWLHTGDCGYVDEDGYLFLDGRQGNMIVLVGGEKLHPEHVEDAVKGSDLITEAMVIGEKCKNVYVCVNVDPDLSQSLPAKELETRLRKDIQARTEHLAQYQRPRDFLILPDFSVEDGTLTVTLKIRRHKVWEQYGDRINAFLRNAGEEIATKTGIGIASSRVLETLTRGGNGNADEDTR